METEYRRDANHSYLIIKKEDGISNDYAVNMLVNNKIPGIIETRIRSFNNSLEFHYDISSRAAMSSFYAQYKMGDKEIRKFIFGLSLATDSIKEYLLDINCICLDYNLIFINTDTEIPEFCYCPGLDRDFFGELRALLQKILALINYESRQAVEMAYGMQQIINNENYTVEELFRFISLGTCETQGEIIDKYRNGNMPNDGLMSSDGEYVNGNTKAEDIADDKRKNKYTKRGVLNFIRTGFLKRDKPDSGAVDKLNDM